MIAVPKKGVKSLFEIVYHDKEGISDFKMFKDNAVVKVNYLKDPGHNPILYTTKSKGAKDSNLYVYLFGITESFTVARSDSEMDLSNPINRLIEDNHIKRDFTIWSPQEDVVLYNPYIVR